MEANVAFMCCDHRDDFDSVQLSNMMNKWPCLGLKLIFPDVGHIVDAKMAVVCPESAIRWIHDNAIRLHDSNCDGFYWNGERVIGLNANRERVALAS